VFASLKVESEVRVGDLPIVRDFIDFFPEDIVDLPPEREVEFVIEVVPRTSHISTTPYRISASELCELKKQLEDLFDKKFISLSVSPWEALVLLVKKKHDSMRLFMDYRQLNMKVRKTQEGGFELCWLFLLFFLLKSLVRSS